MAAIFAAYRVACRLRPKQKSVQFGFPYVDTLKILERFPEPESSVEFFPNGDQHDLLQLNELLNSTRVAGLFCEIPSNPLLASPNVTELSQLAARHGFPLAVDDTLGAVINTDVLPVVDMLTTSLTKFFSGAGDVIAGSLILNRDRSLYASLRDLMQQEYEDLLFDVDAEVLERNSRDVTQRIQRINGNTEALCSFLKSHPLVERVYYPKYVTPDLYMRFKRPAGSFGGLFSLDIRDAARNAPVVFDSLGISKGPNLGTNFSLCCPFTILAHYQELELEDSDWLIRTFRDALEAARCK